MDSGKQDGRVSQITPSRKVLLSSCEVIVSGHFLLIEAISSFMVSLSYIKMPHLRACLSWATHTRWLSKAGLNGPVISAWPGNTVTGHTHSRAPHELAKALVNLHCHLTSLSSHSCFSSFHRSWFLISILHPKICLTSASGKPKLWQHLCCHNLFYKYKLVGARAVIFIFKSFCIQRI